MTKESLEAIEWLDEKPTKYFEYLDWISAQGWPEDPSGGAIQQSLFTVKKDHEHFSEYHQECSLCVGAMRTDTLLVVD